MLEVNDPVFKEWWTKYPGIDDFCGQCPGCCAIEYKSDIISSKDPLAGSLGWFTSNILSTVNDFILMLFWQW